MKKDVKTETPQAVQDFMDFLLNDDGYYLDVQLRNLAEAICFFRSGFYGRNFLKMPKKEPSPTCKNFRIFVSNYNP